MADALPPLGGLSLNDDPPPDPPPTTVQDLPLEITDVVLASYLAKLEVGELCEANLLQICMALRGTNQCNDPDDPLWKAACARFGLTERLVGGTPDAPATPTWHVTFLAMCKEVATLQPDLLATYKGLLRGDDAYADREVEDRFGMTSTVNRIRREVGILWDSAAKFGRLCMVHYLLRRVDKIVDTELMKHALRVASGSRGQLAVVEVLLAHGADVNARDGDGYTALFWAARGGRAAVVELLLAHGADVAARVLEIASRRDDLAVVEMLLAHGVDLRAYEANNILQNAAAGGRLAVVEALLAHGVVAYADYNMLMRWASDHGRLAVVAALRAAGPKPSETRSSHGSFVIPRSR